MVFFGWYTPLTINKDLHQQAALGIWNPTMAADQLFAALQVARVILGTNFKNGVFVGAALQLGECIKCRTAKTLENERVGFLCCIACWRQGNGKSSGTSI